MNTKSAELQEYIASIVKAIKAGMRDSGFDIQDPIVLDLAIVNSRKPEGGFEIFVVKNKGRYTDSQMSRLKISIKRHQPEVPKL